MSEVSGESRSGIVAMSTRDMIRVIITGVIVGVVSVGLYALFYTYVFQPVLCRPQSTINCTQAPNYSAVVAMVLSSIVGLVMLTRARVYRPRLVVIAVAVALWGSQSVASTLPWYWATLGMAVFGGLSYGLFTWLARIRSFILALVVMIVLVVVVRLVIVS